MRGLLRPWRLSSFSPSFPPGCRIENCESCFSKDFCTKCKSDFYLHKGRCFDKCPEGFAPLEDTMECGGTWDITDIWTEKSFKRVNNLLHFLYLHTVIYNFSVQLLILHQKKRAVQQGPHTKRLQHASKAPSPCIKAWPGVFELPLNGTLLWFHCTSLFLCVSAEGCEVGQWSEWGACTRRNKTCGYKWGLETRTRHIVKKPPKDTIPCPTIAESRMCKMAMRHCRRGKDVVPFSHMLMCERDILSVRPNSIHVHFTLLWWILKKNSPLIP